MGPWRRAVFPNRLAFGLLSLATGSLSLPCHPLRSLTDGSDGAPPAFWTARRSCLDLPTAGFFVSKADLKKDSACPRTCYPSDQPSRSCWGSAGWHGGAPDVLSAAAPSVRAWLTRGELGLELEVTLALSETRLCLEPSRLKPCLKSCFLPG